jgi:asparagine synthase (glutamine-hydrolysing)
MCGIAGWYLRTARAPDAPVLKAMTDAIPHRGPDGEGQMIVTSPDGQNQGGLGHRRLSIIDLSTGDQPMHYTAPDGRRLSIVFNGEVYNFRQLRSELEALGHEFQTTSDTEIIMAAHAEWGPGSAERLRGMFAHIIWEHDTGRMTVVRDRFGKKPVFMAERPEGTYFASEIKSILALPDFDGRLNMGAVPNYLNYRYVPGQETFFEGIVKMPPASVAVCENGQITIRRYWTTPDSRVTPAKQSDDPVTRFMDVLKESVELRMIADVPFGAFLSGGIDSSAVVALMSQVGTEPVKTFSVGFAEGEYSELKYAKEIADQFETDHHELVVSSDTLMDWLPDLIGYRDAPVAEPSDIPIYLLSVEAQKTVKMVLTGEGSDELLAGYPKHSAERYASKYHSLIPGFLHSGLARPLVKALPYRFRRIKTLFDSLSERDIRDRYPRWFGVLGPDARDRLLARNIPASDFDQTPFDAPATVGAMRRLQHFDQTSWLPDNLLERGDRMTMAGSIEGRMPFMDHELAECISNLPDDCRIRGGEDKWVLREGMRRILPESILNRPKVGFRVPVNEWFRTTMRDWVRDHLSGPDSRSSSLYDGRELSRILDEHASARQNHEKLIWTLISFELFLRRYGLNP